jgi:Rod binding domain-containing protein
MSGLGVDTLLSTAQGANPATLAARARSAGPARPGTAEATSEAQAREFEAVFLTTMLQSMFAGLDEDAGTWGGGTGSDAWRGMLVEQYADTIARSGGIGIGDSIKRELLALQEGVAQ